MRRKSSKIPVPNPIRKGFIFQFLELSDFPPKNFYNNTSFELQ
jgi:hypothetical protein